MAGKRTYGDRCGIARALDIVGERWALLVVRELLLGPKRFTDLRAGLPKLGPDILAQRLRELEQAGVVRRQQLPAPAASRVYELTDTGRAEAASGAGSERDFPWDSEEGLNGHKSLRGALAQLVLATKQVQVAGEPELVERAAAIVKEARQKLYQLLAES